ncbi:IS66 family transposase [Gemmata sp.]|uniref:IS66 family transposase n=1 Tax=Gemmata sp. TaxID=1914242 RepID=UPI003F6FEDAE
MSRQEGIIARSGVKVSENTLGDWVGQATALLKPLRDLMRRRLLQRCRQATVTATASVA